MNAGTRSFLDWVRNSLLGHTFLLQFVWIVPLIIVVAGMTLFDRSLTLARLVLIIIGAAIGGIAVIFVGWYSIGKRPPNRE